MSKEENKAIVLRFLQEVWEKGDLDVVDEIIADEHVHRITKRDLKGPEGVRQLVSWLRRFLPDLQLR